VRYRDADGLARLVIDRGVDVRAVVEDERRDLGAISSLRPGAGADRASPYGP
jgi:hypothetical protein